MQAARNTRKGCKELQAFVQSAIDELYAAKEKMSDEDLDDETCYRLAELERQAISLSPSDFASLDALADLGSPTVV